MSNDAENVYVAVSNQLGNTVVVYYDDAAATQISDWTKWEIPLQTFADQFIDLTDVDTIAFGVGQYGNDTTPGGAGKMYVDDIGLYR